MKKLGNTIIINRGETFTTSFTFVDTNDAPYMLSDKWENVYCVIRVSSSVYCQYGKYERTYWLDLNDRPKFVNCEVVPKPETTPTVAFEYLYYSLDVNGNKTYEYWNGTEYKEYSFVINKTFIHEDTSDWLESIYNYEIFIANGQDMRKYLNNTYYGVYGSYPSDILSNRQVWWLISKRNPEIVQGLNYDAALENYEICKVLLKPSKLIINANI